MVIDTARVIGCNGLDDGVGASAAIREPRLRVHVPDVSMSETGALGLAGAVLGTTSGAGVEAQMSVQPFESRVPR